MRPPDAVPHAFALSSKAVGCSCKVNVGPYRLAKWSAAVIVQNDTFFCAFALHMSPFRIAVSPVFRS